jgi:hypothetical protein
VPRLMVEPHPRIKLSSKQRADERIRTAFLLQLRVGLRLSWSVPARIGVWPSALHLMQEGSGTGNIVLDIPA